MAHSLYLLGAFQGGSEGHPKGAKFSTCLVPSGHSDSPHFIDIKIKAQRERQAVPKGTVSQCRVWACLGLDYVCFNLG